MFPMNLFLVTLITFQETTAAAVYVAIITYMLVTKPKVKINQIPQEPDQQKTADVIDFEEYRYTGQIKYRYKKAA